MITENVPGVLPSVRDGGTLKDWPKRIVVEISTEVTHLVKDVIQLRYDSVVPARHVSKPYRTFLFIGE